MKLQQAFEAFDALHAQDPERDADGAPRELAYAQRMSAWLARLSPQASEALRLAVRCQHLRRWTLRREDYPPGPAGYRRWRTDEAAAHAATAGEVLRGLGYDAAAIARVQSLVRKENLKQDAEAQTLEDASCLVFLEHYLDEFARKHPEEAMLLRILSKTWRKMSPGGRDAALRLPLSPAHRALIAKALETAP